MYIYPENLKARATLWFWNLNDVVVLGILLAFSLLCFSAFYWSVPLIVSVLFAILTIRIQDYSILDFIGSAVCFFAGQQCYRWRE